MDQAEKLYQLAMRHIYGDGVEENNERALELLTEAAELGHLEAAYNLGICYHYGYGTAVDLARAWELYLRCAQEGHGKGMELVGRFYARGIHVEADRAQAEFWLRKAMENGEEEEAARELERMNGGGC